MTFSDFFDRLADLDWLAVVVGTVVFMVVGMLWYGPLFGKKWSAGTGIAMEGGMPKGDKLIGTAIYSFVASAAVNYFGVLDDIEHALVMGIVLGVLVIGAATYAGVVWMNHKRSTWMIDTGYWLVGIAIVGFVQGLMA